MIYLNTVEVNHNSSFLSTTTTALKVKIGKMEQSTKHLSNSIASYEKEIHRMMSQLQSQSNSLELMRRKHATHRDNCEGHLKRIKQLEIQVASFEACKALPSHM